MLSVLAEFVVDEGKNHGIISLWRRFVTAKASDTSESTQGEYGIRIAGERRPAFDRLGLVVGVGVAWEFA